MTTNEMPLTLIEQMDLKQQAYAHEERLAQVASTTELGKAREHRRQMRITAIKDIATEYVPLVYIVVIVSLLFGVAFGIWAMATAGPPKSVEQITVEKKQDRWKDCVMDDDNVWYPQAYDDQGVCLKRGEPAPK